MRAVGRQHAALRSKEFEIHVRHRDHCLTISALTVKKLEKGIQHTPIPRGREVEVLTLSVRVGGIKCDLPPEEWTPGYADFASACSGVMYPMAEWIR